MDTTPTKKTNLHIDPDLWRGLRVRAIEEGVTATSLLNRIIAEYLKKPQGKTAKKGA